MQQKYLEKYHKFYKNKFKKLYFVGAIKYPFSAQFFYLLIYRYSVH